MNRHRFPLVCAAAAAALLLICGCGRSNTADNLKKRMESLHALQRDGKMADAAKDLLAMVPDEARLRRGLADDAEAEIVTAIIAIHEKMRGSSPDRIADAANTQVNVHGATTEDIAANNETAKEFPSGAQLAAQSGALRPGMTYYEVEFVKPGKDSGVKYHLFYWDGSGWSMLGPIWRAPK